MRYYLLHIDTPTLRLSVDIRAADPTEARQLACRYHGGRSEDWEVR